jgi:O-acetyl-ADP-ribose deacetylase (regulator of RNase III)
MTQTLINQTTLSLVRGDITDQQADAIVNAANPTLLGGGGVDGAIHQRGGAAILEACKRIRAERFPDGLPAGEAVVTTAGKLRARVVIHTVGPIWRGGARREAELLAQAYDSCLSRAVETGMHSVLFPSISTGAYGYPKREAAQVALAAVAAFLSGNATLREVRFVLFSDDDLRIYSVALDALLAQEKQRPR